MGDDTLELRAGTRTLRLTARGLEALEELIAQQIIADEMVVTTPRPLLRIVAADATIEHPIACEPRILARTSSPAPPPVCRWRETDRGGEYVCQVEGCGRTIGTGDQRHHELAQLFATGGVTRRERSMIAAVLRRIAQLRQGLQRGPIEADELEAALLDLAERLDCGDVDALAFVRESVD